MDNLSAQKNDNADIDMSFYGEVEETPETSEKTEEPAKSNDTAVAEGGAEQKQTEPIKTETSEKDNGESAKKAAQTAEQNAEFARKRREAETQEKLSKAKEEARISAIAEAVGTNPWTKEPITDAEDVEQYLLMKKIEKDGGDPIQDFPKYSKRANAERAVNAKAEADKVVSQKKDIEDFKAKHPDVDLQTLAKDTDFDDFCDGRLGSKSLSDIYDQYTALKARIEGSVQKQAKEAAISVKAKEIASVGSLENTGEAAEGLYTLEQLKNLSEEDIEANWEKVKKSKIKLKI